MRQSEFFNTIINALGSPSFSEQEVQDALRIQIEQMRNDGQNPGSLIAVANLLPELTREAKKRYERIGKIYL